MLYRSHRGGVYYTPENTIHAFHDAFRQGFASIETDPCFTKDGAIILLHDATINRTCRNSDGTQIEEPIYHKDLTYDELMSFDAGIYKGEKFRGTKVPLLEELLSLAEGTDTFIALDKKIPTDKLDSLFDVVARYKTKVSFSCKDTERIKKILDRFPDAHIDYDGNTTEDDLKAVCDLVPYEQLMVWLYLDKPNFAWLTDRYKTSPENCERVKKYARLGVANTINAYDTFEAIQYDPYMVEV
ncbi:MAG: hypothetical protein E7613_05395 [Ruminococcaceae bacterium]|nr:hypothetical protein [Oscillospiraceae bacterium]